MTLKKLSEYESREGLKILGQLTRAISPLAKDKEFMTKLRGCFSQGDKDDLSGSGAIVFIEFIDLITNDAPELLIELVAIMSGRDKKEVAKANLLDIIDSAMELFNDERLVSFLSNRFSLAVQKQPSTSMTTEVNV